MSYVLILLVTVIYLAVLELSKNVIAGWIVGALAAICLIVYRAVFYKKAQGTKGFVAAWCIFLLVLVANYLITQPPFKRVPAVDNRKPDETAVVTIKQGELTGVYNADHSVRVFAGIPYAKAPVGELRFKEPQGPDKWEGVLKADHFGPMAMQTRGSVFYDSLSHILGWHDYQIKFGDEYREAVSEDCLYLNVYAPEKTRVSFFR